MANPGVMTRRKIRFCLLVLFQLQISIIAGRGILGVPAGPNEMLLSLTLAVVITLACITDSRIIAKPMVPIAKLVMFLTWPLAVPIYLIWSRGAKGFLLLVMHLAMIFGNIVAVALLTMALQDFGVISDATVQAVPE